MRRIGLAVVLAVGLVAVPLMADAQQPASIPRIGFLSPSSLSDPRQSRFLEAFRQGLRELGYAEGQPLTSQSSNPPSSS